ncbi:Threonylcarbamoyl-AMP synthase, partial [Linum perenne]
RPGPVRRGYCGLGLNFLGQIEFGSRFISNTHETPGQSLPFFSDSRHLPPANYSSLPPLILPIWLNARRGLSIQTGSPIEEEKLRKLKHIICDCSTNDGGRMNIPAAAAAARISSCYTLPLVSRSRSRYIASAIPATAFFRNPIQTRIMTALESCCVDEDFGAIRFAVEDSVEEAVDALQNGKVIALPTDSLYGFVVMLGSSEAVSRIYEIKGRKHTILLAICVGDVSDIERFAVTEHLPSGLLDSLLPGPVTLILSRGASSVLDKSLNPGLDSIGVRVPDYDFIRAIARGLGRAIALTSANLSGQPSSVCIKDFQNLWQQCAYVYDDGVLPSGRAGSTIVDLSRVGKYRIVRPGSKTYPFVLSQHKRVLESR